VSLAELAPAGKHWRVPDASRFQNQAAKALPALRNASGFIAIVGILLSLRLLVETPDVSDFVRASLIAYAVVVTSLVIVKTGFWRRWLFWRRPSRAEATRLGSLLNLLYGVLAAFALTEVFVFLTTWLYLTHHVSADPALPEEKIVPLIEQHYLWQLSKELPLLDPTDVGWDEPAEGLTIGGWLAAYKLLVAIPAVGLAKLAYDRHAGNLNTDPEAGSKRIREVVREVESRSAVQPSPPDPPS
jgi:hypothetical protein